jgi:hypothetical protein
MLENQALRRSVADPAIELHRLRERGEEPGGSTPYTGPVPS